MFFVGRHPKWTLNTLSNQRNLTAMHHSERWWQGMSWGCIASGCLELVSLLGDQSGGSALLVSGYFYILGESLFGLVWVRYLPAPVASWCHGLCPILLTWLLGFIYPCIWGSQRGNHYGPGSPINNSLWASHCSMYLFKFQSRNIGSENFLLLVKYPKGWCWIGCN